MIYVSSACVRNNTIKESVEELANHGFKNIELSGGTEYYEHFETDLLDLQKKYDLNYLCHNYFPPPRNHFVLNLASLDNQIYTQSLEHLKSSIDLSKRLGSKKFAFHAGFLLDIKVSEIGKRISKVELADKRIAVQRFCEGFNLLQNYAGDLNLYIENNVFSSTNAKTYDNKNIFMLTNYNEYLELKNKISFNLLLDIAHLKVSANTHKLDFSIEFKNLVKLSNYIHISDNDALHDLNHKLNKNSKILELLQAEDCTNKDFTLEIYDNIESIKESYTILKDVCND